MRVRRRRGIHVLMGTLALVAGCGTSHHTEVSGVVRDRATGRAIPGARVVGADGSLAETDADGRFHLYVDGALVDVRISASGHSPEHLEIEGLDARVALAPLDETWGDGATGAHVLSFVEQTWTLDGGTSDGATTHACTETSLALAHSESGCGDCHAGTTATASCTTCHEAEARALESAIVRSTIAPHQGLGGGCLACHSESASAGDARTSCARCHGAQASTLTADLGRFFALATSATAEPALSGTDFEMRPTHTAQVRWQQTLAGDRSAGAHDPRTVLVLARSVEPRASFYSAESAASPSSSPASTSSAPAP